MLLGQHSTTQVINLFPVVRAMLFPVDETILFLVVQTTVLYICTKIAKMERLRFVLSGGKWGESHR